MADKNAFSAPPKIQKPALFRPQQLGDQRPVGTAFKQAVLKDVAKVTVFKQGSDQ